MYDYNKLVGKIYEKYGSKQAFCKAIGISNPSVVDKLANRVEWKQSEIEKVMTAIGEPTSEIVTYFFTH